MDPDGNIINKIVLVKNLEIQSLHKNQQSQSNSVSKRVLAFDPAVAHDNMHCNLGGGPSPSRPSRIPRAGARSWSPERKSRSRWEAANKGAHETWQYGLDVICGSRMKTSINEHFPLPCLITRGYMSPMIYTFWDVLPYSPIRMCCDFLRYRTFRNHLGSLLLGKGQLGPGPMSVTVLMWSVDQTC